MWNVLKWLSSNHVSKQTTVTGRNDHIFVVIQLKIAKDNDSDFRYHIYTSTYIFHWCSPDCACLLIIIDTTYEPCGSMPSTACFQFHNAAILLQQLLCCGYMWNKGLANAKRPCDCRVLCLRLKSLLCSCALTISDMTSFSCRHQGRDSVCPVLWMSTWRN